MPECSEKSEESKHASQGSTQFSLAKYTPGNFAGPLLGTYVLLVVDAFSKWSKIFSVNRITASKTLSVLKEIFGRFGLPMKLVGDNGPAFSSKESYEFMKSNGIHRTFSAPYHPELMSRWNV